MDYYPSVVQAVAGPDKTVYAYYSDGSVRQFDAAPLIKRGGVFAPLADERFFKERLTVMNDAIARDVTGNYDPYRCIDIDPMTTYENSKIVEDPLESVA